MRQQPLRKRTALVAGLVAIAILTCLFLIGWWKWAADQGDMRTANRLVGRWGVHFPTSPDSAPAEFIYEFLSDGEIAFHRPDGSSAGDADDQWSIRGGDLLWQITVHIPKDNHFYKEDSNETSTTRYQLVWNGEDTVRMREKTGIDSDQFVVLRRLSSN